MKLLLTLATISALAAASVHAGGPVIEDTETRAEPRDRNALVPLIQLGLAVGLLASGGSDAPCNGPDDTPTDGEGC